MTHLPYDTCKRLAEFMPHTIGYGSQYYDTSYGTPKLILHTGDDWSHHECVPCYTTDDLLAWLDAQGLDIEIKVTNDRPLWPKYRVLSCGMWGYSPSSLVEALAAVCIAVWEKEKA